MAIKRAALGPKFSGVLDETNYRINIAKCGPLPFDSATASREPQRHFDTGPAPSGAGVKYKTRSK